MALVLAIAVSLLIFQSVLLWMVAFWLAVAGVAIGRNREAWLPLAACVAVLLIKRPDWSPVLMLLAASMAAVAAILFWKRKSSFVTGRQSRLALVAVGVLWVLWAAAVWGQYSDSHALVANRLDPNRPIVCLGDSLTTGLSDDEAYPMHLQQLVSVHVLEFRASRHHGGMRSSICRRRWRRIRKRSSSSWVATTSCAGTAGRQHERVSWKSSRPAATWMQPSCCLKSHAALSRIRFRAWSGNWRGSTIWS